LQAVSRTRLGVVAPKFGAAFKLGGDRNRLEIKNAIEINILMLGTQLAEELPG
jgi:hypothetical protein